MTKKPRIDPGHGGRSVPEWIGKTPDTEVPERVRLRIFRRYDGKCYLTGAKIRPGDEWDLEDIKPLHADGENRESNKAPALKEPHKGKTKREMAEKAKSDAVAKKHAGIRTAPTRPIQSAGFAQPKPKNRSDRIAKIDKAALGVLPRRICGQLLEEFEQ